MALLAFGMELFLVWGLSCDRPQEVSNTLGCYPLGGSSTHPIPLPSGDTKKCLQTLSEVLCRAKLALVKNHYPIDKDVGQAA